MSHIIIEHFHGAASRVPVAATACAMRVTGFNVVIASQWTDPGETERGIKWARDTFASLTPYLAPTRYVNYLEDDAIDPAAVAYGPNLPRLREIKTKYDAGELLQAQRQHSADVSPEPMNCLSPARPKTNRCADRPGDVRAALSRSAVVQRRAGILFALGRAGGLCDCGDEADDAGSLGSEAAGWPFFGQFVAHDITADRSAPQAHADLTQLRNARSPRLNLECLYGDGPVGHPYLFRRDDPAKLLTAPGGRDLLRNSEGTAIIGDPRNDSHVVMSQMHLAFVHAHNACVDRVRRSGQPEAAVFDAAARELRWHYQTVVLREFLPSLIGPELTGH